ncbi:hypothetical protein CKM354_000217500 [Cercospora kikuchii]|uniref:Uncharacterized protein n=1 Tax=Cercospora kikuchii TaxID=84275 RepID=A0A9P3FDG1_9PEZI|nr:uncharacterized protein CKM354_000217500 [Cercospora kikuchii]GIZ38774.1 hypothetical protein CKM354_000217500 [Cercospora kikuchii]
MSVHAHTLLGGPIPVAQANAAILSQFLSRFKSGGPAERPWIELVMARAVSSTTPSLISTALQANASALCANDLQHPEISKHATKLYLFVIERLQALLRSPSWSDTLVLHTCMIISFYDRIAGKDPAGSHAHVRGVARLIQAKGPQSFISGIEHQTFRYYRINIFMISVADRTPCFLAEADWRNIPFSGDCPPKTILDILLDSLTEIPGVLAAAENLSKGGLSRYVLVQKAFELAYRVRCLIWDLEKWKELHIWTYPAICEVPNSRNLDLLALCKLITELHPYDARLGEALSCYTGAQLILARVAQRLGERSFLMRTALRLPHTLYDLVSAIVLVSRAQITAEDSSLITLIVTTFPLKVAQGTTELQDPELHKAIRDMLSQVAVEFSRRYNLKYTTPS